MSGRGPTIGVWPATAGWVKDLLTHTPEKRRYRETPHVHDFIAPYGGTD